MPPPSSQVSKVALKSGFTFFGPKSREESRDLRGTVTSSGALRSARHVTLQHLVCGQAAINTCGAPSPYSLTTEIYLVVIDPSRPREEGLAGNQVNSWTATSMCVSCSVVSDPLQPYGL